MHSHDRTAVCHSVWIMVLLERKHLISGKINAGTQLQGTCTVATSYKFRRPNMIYMLIWAHISSRFFELEFSSL